MCGDYSDSSWCRIHVYAQNIRIRNHHRHHHDDNLSSSLSSVIEIYVNTSVQVCTEAARNCVSIDRFTWYSNVYLYVVVKWIEPRNSINVFNKAKTTVIYWVWGKKGKIGFWNFPPCETSLNWFDDDMFPSVLISEADIL